MRIGFWLTTPKRFDPLKIDETPFGGAEISAIQLAREITKKYGNVDIYGNVDVWDYDNLTFPLPFFKYGVGWFRYDMISKREPDILIVVRADQNILNPRRNQFYFSKNRPKKIVLWTGDAYDQPNNQILHDRYSLNEIDQIVVKSDWQLETLLRHYPLLSKDKLTRIYNGFDVSLIPPVKEVKEPKFIYASTAYRGLYRFINIWPKIKEQIPDATLDCYCKTTLYLDDNPREREFLPFYEKLSSMDGITIKDPLPQKDLLKIMPNYFAMLYPNSGFVESSCGVALQAMACGLPVITSKRAGLIETILMGQGSLVDGHTESSKYENDFIRDVKTWWQYRNDDSFMSVKKSVQKDIKQKYSWEKVSKEWETTVLNFPASASDSPAEVVSQTQDSPRVSAVL